MSAKIVGLNLDKDDLYQEIDLRDFGLYDVDSAKAEAIGQELIDLMIERTTEKSKSVDGRPLPSYSKPYKESETFKQYGKTNKVDMTLSGDMLGSIDVLEAGDTVKIGFIDTLQSNKAYGHMTGMKKHPFLDGKVEARKFFGVGVGAIEDVVAKYRDDDPKTKKVGEILEGLTFIEQTKTEDAFDFLIGDFFNV